MKKILCAVAIGSVLAVSASVFADLSAGQKMAVEALIKQFTAADFDARQKAVDRLIEMGPDVVPVVKKAMNETADNEVKMRCEMVLKKLGAVEPPLTPKKAAEQKFGTDAAKVTVHAKDVELDTVLQSLAEQSGNARLEAPKDWEGKTVSLDVTDVPYWEAVNRLSADLKLVVVFDPMQGGGLRLAAAKETVPPAACAGPVDVRIASITLMKQYVPQAGPVNFLANAPALSLNLTWFHEDRLRPLDVDAKVAKISVSNDRELVLIDNKNPMGMAFNAVFAMMGGNQNTTTGDFSAASNDAPGDVRVLKSVEGVVKLTFGTGERELKIEDADVGKSVTVGKDKVTVGQFKLQGGAATVNVRHEVDGQEVEDHLGTNTPYGLVLVDPKGNRHAPAPQNAGGLFNVMRAGIAGGPANVKVQVHGGPGMGWAVGDMENAGGITAQFQGLPDVEGKWSVILTLPETTTVKECPFKLTNVPLP